jgi:hypothetical protein
MRYLLCLIIFFVLISCDFHKRDKIEAAELAVKVVFADRITTCSEISFLENTDTACIIKGRVDLDGGDHRFFFVRVNELGGVWTQDFHFKPVIVDHEPTGYDISVAESFFNKN